MTTAQTCCVQHDEDNCSCQHAEGRPPKVKRMSPDCPQHGHFVARSGEAL